jgi:alpha-N-arabinofuranosidase
MKLFAGLFICAATAAACLAASPTLTIDASHAAGPVSPRLYGLMTEEINHSYDGGLYAELIQNRAFLDDAATPVHWFALTDTNAAATILLDPDNALNDQLNRSLRVAVTKADRQHASGVANDGYWGIPVQSRTSYHASLNAKAEAGFTGPVTVSIVSDDGRKVFATEKFSGLTTEWKKFEVTLKTGRIVPTARAHFAITIDRPATFWLGLVSLFPPTWNDQPNGFRRDLMQMLVDLHPKFLRFPGGNYVEGDTVDTRFDWQQTIGPLERRHGHACPWGYRSTDGLGLLEFLEWCEDMRAEPVLAVYAGYSLHGTHVHPGPDLAPFVQDALDEIEYVTGDTNTAWGAQRAKDGHPAPFALNYVEIGNEDWFDKSGSYDQRFAQFYDAIKARHPQLKTISTIGNDQRLDARVHSRQPDATDEHYYQTTDTFLQQSPDYAKAYDRHGPEIFVGEWAAHETSFPPWDERSRAEPATPNLKAALGDAAFMAAMERNSDLIKMQCYAPLLVNVNPGARQWRPDLIGYDALSAYGSPSYYAFQMFSRSVGDEILALTATGTPVQGSATRDRQTGEIILKLVNPQSVAQTLNLEIDGAGSLAATGRTLTLAGNPEDTNSLGEPRKVVPRAGKVHGVKNHFPYTLPPNSIVVLKLKAKS